LRINTQFPEFYLREVQPDYDKIRGWSAPAGRARPGPEVELIRATVKGITGAGIDSEHVWPGSWAESKHDFHPAVGSREDRLPVYVE